MFDLNEFEVADLPVSARNGRTSVYTELFKGLMAQVEEGASIAVPFSVLEDEVRKVGLPEFSGSDTASRHTSATAKLKSYAVKQGFTVNVTKITDSTGTRFIGFEGIEPVIRSRA